MQNKQHTQRLLRFVSPLLLLALVVLGMRGQVLRAEVETTEMAEMHNALSAQSDSSAETGSEDTSSHSH